MGREGGEQDEEISKHGYGFGFPCDGFVDEYHHGGNGGVESHAVEIFGNFLDRRVKRL